ncbi:hypothetical protein BX600DRAFT_497051 [Xylariales sp. PMI_506]|nr:hypothetical protein BX600DRAFT_497051 [Xylariales sp. PMI_506]
MSVLIRATVDSATSATLDHSHQGYIVIITLVVCMVLATTAVSLRIYTRKVIVNEIWIDDYLAIVAWLFLLGLSIIEGIAVRDGVGTHIWDIPAGGLSTYLKESWIGLMMYNLCLFATKSMYFFQYYRIVADIRHLRITYIVVMTLVTCWTIAQVLLLSLTCIPIQKLWDKTVTGAHCLPIPSGTSIWLNSTGNMITDIIILVLPLPVVWRLNLPKTQKWVLFGVFALGFFTCFISACRLIFLREPTDLTWDAVSILSWSVAEVASALICAAVPTLRALASIWFPNWGFSTHRQTTKGYSKHSSTFGAQKRSHVVAKSGSSSGSSSKYQHDDLEIQLERPHLTRIEDLEAKRFSHHSPKSSIPTSVYSLSAYREASKSLSESKTEIIQK